MFLNRVFTFSRAFKVREYPNSCSFILFPIQLQYAQNAELPASYFLVREAFNNPPLKSIMKTNSCRSFSTQGKNKDSIGPDEKRNLPAEVSNFTFLRGLKCPFVDKTLLIKEIFNLVFGAPLLITRPRGWGKSVNLSMLQAYFDVLEKKTFELTFQGTEVYKDENFKTQHANKYPVIFINFDNFVLGPCNKIPWPESQFQKELNKTIERYSADIFNSPTLSKTEKNEFFELQTTTDKREIVFGLRTLMEILHKHYKRRCIILIDDYDNPYNTAAQESNSQAEMSSFKATYGVFLTAALKSAMDQSLQFAILTGVLRVSLDEYGLNNLTCDMVVRGQGIFNSKFYGFTEKEVKEMIKKTSEFSPKEFDKLVKNVKLYSNGYRRFGDQEAFYSPWSVAQFCRTHEFHSCSKDCYLDSWFKKSYETLPLFEKAELEFLVHKNLKVKKHLKDTIHIENLSTDPSIFWSLLVHNGYLTFAKKSSQKFLGGFDQRKSLIIPNQNALEALKSVTSGFESLLSPDFKSAVKASIQDNDFSKLFETLNNWISEGQTHNSFNSDESAYHMFLYETFRICLSGEEEEWKVYSERIVKKERDRFDIALSSKDRFYLFELTLLTEESPLDLKTKFKEALNKIDAEKYLKDFKESTIGKKIAKIAIVVKRKTLYHQYQDNSNRD